ncbi:YceD family protein [Pelagovum pacificum]|uniref:DUF177 domain-containing protein n=1 Tax=Pelagovum pacificum TaxID=2588711 RepID=A0A5C5GDE3_9RHOB|nr:DUF177 domain-containing protein [Pelagovum pacificum]QQA44353.1 DUF177 domain-containing protein [Pelagovum pacificum]TNY32530.1 DUF177 domain-containing protein [Pelagovum pacificum]
MSDLPTEAVRLADLPGRKTSRYRLEPDAAGRAAIADTLGIEGVKKFRFEAELSPLGKTDWQLTGKLGATVVQACVVTLDPVTTRIEESASRSYLSRMSEPEGGTEVEMPDDDTSEPLPATLDLYTVALEALALSLPAYPRSEGAALEEANFAEPGVEPLSDEDVKPFAGLAALRDKLSNGGGDDGKGE